MQLKYTKSIRNKIIIVELETINFTARENMLIEQLGEPIIKFDKVYMNKFPVEFERRLKNGFRVRVKFNGSYNIEEASAAAQSFFEDIQLILSDELLKLEDISLGVDFKAESGLITIK